MKKQDKHAQIKELYIKGLTITEIAQRANVTRQTVYGAKKRDLEAGIDWDELALANARDLDGVKMSEKEFLTSLIKAYESAMLSLDEKDPIAKLEILKSFATAYYKLKAPIKTDCKGQVIEAINAVIGTISELGVNDKTVSAWLATNADKIIEQSLSKIKSA